MILIALVAGMVAATPLLDSGGQSGLRPLVIMLSTCGLREPDYGLAWDDALQDEVVTIRLSNDRLSDRSLTCIADASFAISATYLFQAPDAQRRYERAKSASPETAVLLKEYREEARHWLSKRGLLAGALALRDKPGTLAKRAKQVEVYSGYSAGSMLTIHSEEYTLFLVLGWQ